MTGLRKIAKSHDIFDGAITVYFTPIVTVRHNIAVGEAHSLFAQDKKDSEWFGKMTDPQYIFMCMEGGIIDIEFNGMDEDDERHVDYYSIWQYWEYREDNQFSVNWQWWYNCLTREAMYLLNEAYKATRRNNIPKLKNADILKQTPPEPDTPENEKKTGNGRKRTRTK